VTLEAARLRTVWQVGLMTAGFLILVAISAASLYLGHRARTGSLWVTHTIEVESQIGVVQLQLQRAESAVRGFLLTQDKSYRTGFEQAEALIAPSISRLKELTQDNPVEQNNIATLEKLVKQRLQFFHAVIPDIDSGRIDQARAALMKSSQGDEMSHLLDIARDMRAEENRLFELRTEAADRSQALNVMVTVVGSGFIVLLAILSILLLRTSARARNRAEVRLRDINLNLESAVDERTVDLREANQEIQRFAYIVSHDLRSPLVNIMGFTSELEELRGDIFSRIARYSRAAADRPPPAASDGSVDELALAPEDQKLSEEFSEALGFIKSSIGKMDRLISAILKLTREGRREFNPVHLDMHALVQEITNSMTHQATEANAQINIEPLPNMVSDRLALEQIFSNLIENALKFLRNDIPGEISIRGRTKLGFAVYEVTDNGRGIDPNDHDRIFDLFRRAGTQDKPGQGIGLAHVRALVRRLGGSITVSSELDKGSTFTITLPAQWKLSTQGKSYG